MDLAVERKSVESDEYKELIRQLVYEWAKVELPGSLFSYSDYINIIGQLLTAIQSREQTEYLFSAVIKQAVQLGKTSAWVAHELSFESSVGNLDRTELALILLQRSRPVRDRDLDIYNERIRRFTLATKQEEHD